MKKFLFTLAALMMAGSAFANDYLFIEDFQVPQGGGEVEVTVKAHFDAYVSAWQVNLQLPEGVTIAEAWEGDDMTIAYKTSTGRNANYPVTLSSSLENAAFIAASQKDGYYQVDGAWVSYGAIKWEAGDYENMFGMILVFPADFTGGQIKVRTAPASGQDPRGPITNGTVTDYDDIPACNVTIEGGVTPTPEDFVGTASVVFNENVATISYTSNDPNADVVVTVNGTETEVNWNRAAGTATWTAPINTTPGHYSYTVKLTVTPDGENFVGDAVSAQDTYEYDVLEKTATPVITIVEEHHNWVSFDVEGDGTVLVYVDGNLVEPAADGHYYVYASTEADVTYVVTATAQENGKEISDTATETIEIAKWDAVNELVNGKTIANVRYFNMAGQEMQSVNGMTIKVTTYTDGTTSAVKVMK